MSHGPGKTMKLPRLRTKDELLKTSPEIFNKLLLGDDMSTARSSAAPAAASSGAAGGKLARPGVHSASPPHRSASGRAGQLGSATATYDTPRGFGDEPLSENQELAVELESVKRERHQLMDSIAHVKAAAGTAGGEAQQADIRQLLKELELKKSKLNELKGDSRKAEASIARIRDDDTDAQRLTPDGCVEETAYIQCLQDEMAQVEEDLQDADAKNRLYQLLGERTRREHMAINQKVRDKQECLRACNEDLANLTQHFNATRAAKELAQKEAAKVKRQVEEGRADWTRKIRERRAEVSELQRRQRKDHEKEVKRREKLQDKEKAERAAQARLRMEEEAYQLQVAALAPKIEAMEASWNRLRAISGAETPEQVIEYWQGLQAKEARMRELVALAERREAACKAEVTRLLASRSRMYKASSSSSSGFAVGGAQQGSAAGAAADAAAAAAEAAAAAAEAEAAARDAAAGCGDEEEAQATVEAATAKIAEAERRMAVAQAQFNKLRSVCVAADQGMRSLVQRLSIALEAPAAMTASAAAVAAATAAAEASSHSQAATPGQQSGSRLTPAGADGMRRSGGGSSVAPGHHRAGSRDHGAEAFAAPGLNPLASKAHRVPASSVASRARGGLDRTGSAASHTGGLPLVPEDSTGSSSSSKRRQQQHQRESSPGMLGAAQAGVNNSRPLLPSRGRNTIDDDSFFEGLPQLLSEVTDKLERLLCSGQGLDLTAITAAAAAGGLGSGTGSAASTARRHSGGGSSGLPVADAVGGDSSVAPAATDEVSQHASTEAAAAEGGGAEAAEGDGAQAEAAPEEAAGAAEQEHGEPEAAEELPEAAAAASEDKQQDEHQDEAAAAPDGAVAEAQPAAEPAAASPAPAAAAQPADAAAAAMSPAAGSESGGSPAAAATSPGGSSFIATQSPTFAGRASAASSILLNEKALLKGMHRRTWVGAPWLDAVSANPLDTKLVPLMKRKKGKKGDAASGPDLSRILGYIPPNDVPAESESDGDDSDDAACCGGGAVTAADAVVDRQWIKMRAAKLTARHNAKAAAAAAAQAQGGSGR